MIKAAPKKPKPQASRRRRQRTVTASRPNRVWHIDLTTVPTVGGFWIPWWPFAIPQRWPFCWWVAAAIDHLSRRVVGITKFKKEPTANDVTKFLDRTCKKHRCRPGHIISDHGPQFTAEKFEAWRLRRGIQQRLGAVGRYGSIAVVERFIRSMKNECTRLLAVVPLAGAAFGRELDDYAAWYNAERPHSHFGARTPDEVYFGRFPACRKPRYEPRELWPRRSRCAGAQTLVRGRPGALLELSVTHVGGRKHLPVVALRRVA